MLFRSGPTIAYAIYSKKHQVKITHKSDCTFMLQIFMAPFPLGKLNSCHDDPRSTQLLVPNQDAIHAPRPNRSTSSYAHQHTNFCREKRMRIFGKFNSLRQYIVAHTQSCTSAPLHICWGMLIACGGGTGATSLRSDRSPV